MIDLIYKTLLTIINKDHDGYINPTEFDILANKVQLEIFRNYFSDENRDKNKKSRGLTNKGYSNLDFNERQKITQFASFQTISKLSGQFNLPEDLYFIEDDGIMHADPVTSSKQPRNVIEEVERSVTGYFSNSIVASTEVYPTYENYGKYLIVSPSTINTISVRYIRKPKMPRWTYVEILGSPQFDPSNPSFQDFELHESEFTNIVLRMLTDFGINLREEEVIQIAETLKDKLEIKDNQ